MAWVSMYEDKNTKRENAKKSIRQRAYEMLHDPNLRAYFDVDATDDMNLPLDMSDLDRAAIAYGREHAFRDLLVNDEPESEDKRDSESYGERHRLNTPEETDSIRRRMATRNDRAVKSGEQEQADALSRVRRMYGLDDKIK